MFVYLGEHVRVVLVGEIHLDGQEGHFADMAMTDQLAGHELFGGTTARLEIVGEHLPCLEGTQS